MSKNKTPDPITGITAAAILSGEKTCLQIQLQETGDPEANLILAIKALARQWDLTAAQIKRVAALISDGAKEIALPQSEEDRRQAYIDHVKSIWGADKVGPQPPVDLSGTGSNPIKAQWNELYHGDPPKWVNDLMRAQSERLKGEMARAAFNDPIITPEEKAELLERYERLGGYVANLPDGK